MTRETAQKHREAFNAFCEGKTIQYRLPGSDNFGDWTDNDSPVWNADYEYRIKPREPVIAKYNSTIGSSRLAFHPGAEAGVDYKFIEMTPEVAEAVKHLLPKQILPDETP